MDGVAFNGSANTGELAISLTVRPPASPRATAATVLATAKSNPSPLAVIANIAGSMSGEASQNAITAESGAPAAKRAATKGITWHEQNGDRPPTSAPKTIIRVSRP